MSKQNWMIPESKRYTTNILAVIREYLQYAFWVKRAISIFEQNNEYIKKCNTKPESLSWSDNMQETNSHDIHLSKY